MEELRDHTKRLRPHKGLVRACFRREPRRGLHARYPALLCASVHSVKSATSQPPTFL